MKNLLLVVLCLFAIRSYPQTFKGDIGIGGYISANYNKSEFDKNFHAGVTPDVGYFLFDNFIVGARLGYSYSVSDFNNFPSRRRHYLYLGPLVRYYVPIVPKWTGIMHAGHNWSWSFNVTDKETYRSTDFHLGLGMGHFIAKNVSVEGMFYYQKEQRLLFLAGLQVYLIRNKSVTD